MEKDNFLSQSLISMRNNQRFYWMMTRIQEPVIYYDTCSAQYMRVGVRKRRLCLHFFLIYHEQELRLSFNLCHIVSWFITPAATAYRDWNYLINVICIYIMRYIPQNLTNLHGFYIWYRASVPPGGGIWSRFVTEPGFYRLVAVLAISCAFKDYRRM